MDGVLPISKAEPQTKTTSSDTTIGENNNTNCTTNRISLGQPSPPSPSAIALIVANNPECFAESDAVEDKAKAEDVFDDSCIEEMTDNDDNVNEVQVVKVPKKLTAK